MKSLDTVNVVCMSKFFNGSYSDVSIKSWEDGHDGNKSAEEFFQTFIDNEDRENIDDYLNDGFYHSSEKEMEIFLIHST